MFLARAVSAPRWRAAAAAGAAAAAAAATAAATNAGVACDDAPPEHLSRWFEGWKQGRTRFHKLDVNPTLTAFKSKLLAQSPKSILVPLCGKTVDMAALAEESCVDLVVGVECVEQALLELEEQPGRLLGFQRIPDGINSRRVAHFKSWAGAVQKPAPAKGGSSVARVVVLEGDFFKLQGDDLPGVWGSSKTGTVDAVWDRASLVAIRPEDREQYAATIDRVLAEKGVMLLTTFDYDQTKAKGPPFAVPEPEVNRLFPENAYDVELLARTPYDMSDNPKFGSLSEFHECIFLVTKK